MSQRTPIDRLCHILDNIERAALFLKDRKREDLDTDIQLLYAVQHCLQIIGEAAQGVPKELRARFPTIPWELMVRMRHHLVHDYDAVIANVVWDTATVDLPKVMDAILKVIPPENT